MSDRLAAALQALLIATCPLEVALRRAEAAEALAAYNDMKRMAKA